MIRFKPLMIVALLAFVTSTSSNVGAQWYEQYQDLDAIEARTNQFAIDHPSLVTQSVIGQSYEGRDIHAFKIAGTGGTRAVKPAVLINSMMHAREWISPMAGMYAAEQLLTGYGNDDSITRILDQVDVYLMPVGNPDGYAYSWASPSNSHRLWRKNRRLNDDGTIGVDLNRNFGFAWGGEGSSGDGDSNIFRGESAFSEPEAQAVRDFYLDHPNIVGNIDLHSHGQLILSPYGYAEDAVAPDHVMFDKLGSQMELAMTLQDLQPYIYETLSDLYVASGTQSDWSYGTQNVYSYTYELRSQSAFPGFELPADEIVEASQDAFAGIMKMFEFTADLASGDFNYDGAYDCADLERMAAEFATNAGEQIGPESKFEFDMSGDGVLSPVDVRTWLDSRGFRPGDANLDGVVDTSDLRLWTQNQDRFTHSFCHGDFNTDGIVDDGDFEIWRAATVPEPSAFALVLMAACLLGYRLRQR